MANSSLFLLAQFLSRTLNPVPKFGIGFTERNRRFPDLAVFFLHVPANLGLMIQIEGDRSVYLGQFQQRIALLYCLGRVAPLEGLHDGIERDPGARNIVAALPLLDVFAAHQVSNQCSLNGCPTMPNTMPILCIAAL